MSGRSRTGGVRPDASGVSSGPGAGQAEQLVGSYPYAVDAIDVELKTTQKATITKILKGKVKDFIPVEKLKRQEVADRDAFKIFIKAEDGREGSFVVTYSLNKNSTLRRFISKYGKAPYVGQVIDVTENERGFLKPVL